MYNLNLFLILLVAISLYSKLWFSYLIALLLSLAAATFIYSGSSLSNILLTIFIFNLTPFIGWRFNLSAHTQQVYLSVQSKQSQFEHEQMSKERSLLRQSNLRLSEDVSHIVELYNVTRDMSAVLELNQLFAILGKKLTETFEFKRSRLLLLDEQKTGLEIKEVWEFLWDSSQAALSSVESCDNELLKISLKAQKITYLKEKSIASIVLSADSKLLGVLAVEGISIEMLDKFSILANQFALEFKRARLYKKIEELAITDGLTGLFVRRYFLERLNEEITRSARHNLKLSFLMIDIDHFKRCNDTFGHLSGDTVLREVAVRIKSCVREIDLVARYGGEEFCVLLPDTGKKGAEEVAERIRQLIAEDKFTAYDELLEIQISVGVSAFPEDAVDLEQLVDQADQAMYQAKESGRNKVCLFKPSVK